MNSNNELPAWMGMTKGGKRTSAYTAKAAPKKKSRKRVVRSKKEQMARQEEGKRGD